MKQDSKLANRMKDLCVTLICSKWALFSSTTLRLKEPSGQTKEKSIQTYFKLPRRKISLCAPTWYTNLNSVSLIFNSGFLMTTLNVFCLWQYRHSSLLYNTECVDYNIVTCVKDFNLAVGLILTESLTCDCEQQPSEQCWKAGINTSLHIMCWIYTLSRHI